MTNAITCWPADSQPIDGELILSDEKTYRGFVAASPRKHGAFQYAFKAMGAMKVAAAEQAIQEAAKRSRAAGAELMAKIISEQIVWCQATGQGLTPQQVMQLRDGIFNRVWFQLLGAEPMDESPEADEMTALDALQDSAV